MRATGFNVKCLINGLHHQSFKYTFNGIINQRHVKYYWCCVQAHSALPSAEFMALCAINSCTCVLNTDTILFDMTLGDIIECILNR